VKVRLRVIGGPEVGRVVVLEGRQNLIAGRATDAQLCVAGDAAFSRHHFLLEVDPPRMYVRDLDSRHGTFVNGRRVGEADLRSGDEVRGGETVLRVELADEAAAGDLATLAAPPPTRARTRQQRPTADPTEDLENDAVAVRCRCGAVAPHEPARLAAEGVVYLCERCQRELAEHPVLPPGFQVVRELGRGNMGCVYLARHDELGDRAIKQILPKAAMTAHARALFLREASVQARLDHPRIVRVFELVEPMPGGFSIVMEFVGGESADKLLARGPLEPRTAVEIACQALEGLAHAHARGVVHRDIKEGNLLVHRAADGGLAVKVADFGLAKNYQESGASGFTRDGDLGGTLPYMPKEQLIDFRYVQPPADIYALGATLYRLLTGAFPRDYREGDNWVLVTLERPIVPLRQRAPSIDARLAAAVEKALATEPAQRYRSADEMRAALIAATS
jgi:serine/threonine-protein kinase